MFLYRRIFIWAGQFVVLKWAKKYLLRKNRLYLLPIVASVLEFVRQKSEEKLLREKQSQLSKPSAPSEEVKK